MTKEEWYTQLFEHLGNSKFRSSFHLKQKDIDYINEKGLETIREHAMDFIAKREAPAVIPNDGKQTPTKGHPVFIAQHATATCCRECIRKWHKIQPGRNLSQIQQEYLVDVIMTWIQQELDRYGAIAKGEKPKILPEHLQKINQGRHSFRRCSYCGYETTEDFVYCPKCGNIF